MIFPARLGTSAWLLQLRWIAVLGQLITIAVAVWGLGLELPGPPLFALIGLTAATNIVYTFWLWPIDLPVPGQDDRSDGDGRDSLIAAALMLLIWERSPRCSIFPGGPPILFAFSTSSTLRSEGSSCVPRGPGC